MAIFTFVLRRDKGISQVGSQVKKHECTKSQGIERQAGDKREGHICASGGMFKRGDEAECEVRV